MKKIIIIIVALAVLTGIFFLTYKFWPKKNDMTQVKGSQIKYNQIKIGGREIKAEVVDNEESRMKGLSGRESLCNNCSMLFVFEKPDIYPFWMKEMKFAIDIIWINNHQIVEITRGLPPPTETGQIASYTPKTAADLVLEVNAGFAAKNQIKIGDEVKITN